jgi:uncharacterized protein YbaA (DUF1428 family)
MAYVDGFVLSIPKKNRAAYKKMAREGAALWKKFGALILAFLSLEAHG